MRRIIFSDETVEEIRQFINDGHTKRETCNRFTIKLATLNRVMWENHIEPFYKNKKNQKAKEVDDATVELVCNLFRHTNMYLKQICEQAKVEYYQLQTILKDNFPQSEVDKRRKASWSKSKLEGNNAMRGKFGVEHPNYKGIIPDGKGYLMVLKPSWYTGRKGSKHIFLHHVVFCEATGLTQIPEGFCVHHINGNKLDNDISNLCLVSIAGHSKLHLFENNLCKVQRLSK